MEEGWKEVIGIVAQRPSKERSMGSYVRTKGWVCDCERGVMKEDRA